MCLRFLQVLKFGGKRESECKVLEGKAEKRNEGRIKYEL